MKLYDINLQGLKMHTNKNTKILYWNPRSIVNKKEELIRITENIEICIIVESWLNDRHKNFNIPSFKTVRKDRNYGNGGGILILLRNNFAFKPRSFRRTRRRNYYKCKSKNRINRMLPTPGIVSGAAYQWEVILNNVKDNSNTLFVGDFISHHFSWNCNKNDSNGVNLYNGYINKNLFLHNSTTITYTQPYNDYESNIDLVFSSNRLSDKTNVHVEDDTMGSDHYPITIDIILERELYYKRMFKIRSPRTNWAEVVNYLEQNIDQLFTADYAESKASEKYNTFVEIVIKAIKTNTPKRKKVSSKKHRNPVAWWNPECERANSLRKESFIKWKTTKEIPDFIAYKKNKATTRKLIKTECISILFGVEIALTHMNRNFVIFTDSLSAVLSLGKNKIGIRTNSYVYTIKKKILDFHKKSNNNKIQIYRIPGHLPGLRGNDIADRMAKEAASWEPDSCCKIPFTDFKEYFKNKAKAITNTYVSDHYNLAASLARSNIVENPYCSCSEDQNIKQDLDHILWHCPLYNVQRSTLMEKLKQLKFQEPLASFVILCDPTSELCGTLLRFFRDCKLQI
ncbi:hypothetical protein TSAR_014571 [Trichomalopsis sarcophagae]|uniref:Endonuclease/exonuclease/phosphatase domain-containing protein n=1 Tax=Trichomalopsis sarcophagae TaxID=543379 RepID=A0A232EK64_9HYME|nr:hypothetical protein TSAR_014571 [Trichomalopsis sarcophagae]